MRPIPLPVRIAAGLMVTALEQARRVPEQLAELPVSAASRVVQAGMRIQQQVTRLAVKGDEVFAMFRPVQDTPPWAHFDEDDEAPGRPGAQARPDFGPDTNGRGEVDESLVAQRMAPQRPDPARPGTRAAEDSLSAAPGSSAPRSAPRSAAAGEEPTVLAGYDELSLAQLRGKLRSLSLGELEALLEHEHAHRDRAPFVTMLSNRISTVRSR